MSVSYKFYVQMDGQTYGPYTAKEVGGLGLNDEVLVTEESMNGQWLPAGKFDFDDMIRKEQGIPAAPKPKMPVVNADGSVTNPGGWPTKGPAAPQQNPYQQPYQQQPYQQPYQQQNPYQQNPYQQRPYQNPYQNPEDDSSPVGWCILAFIIPLVGWILYFVWRSDKPKKASAVCTWAWIGFAVNFFIMLL